MKPFLLFWGLAGLCLVPPKLSAQVQTPEVFASGGTAAAHAFTIGEAIVETLDNGTVLLSQGFHQPQMSLVATSEPQPVVSATAYPNPTAGPVRIKRSEGDWMSGRVDVISMAGQRVLTHAVEAGTPTIEMDLAALANGLYLLVVRDGREEILHRFRIEKIDY